MFYTCKHTCLEEEFDRRARSRSVHVSQNRFLKMSARVSAHICIIVETRKLNQSVKLMFVAVSAFQIM